MTSQTLKVTQEKITGGFEYFLILALCVDLFTPYLIWKGFVPAQVRWASHAAVAAIMMITLLRMLSFNHIPRSFWLIVAVSLIWSVVAIGNGQGLPATVWGVWLLFQFPFVGLFACVQPAWPRNLPELIRKSCLWILGLQVFFQLIQYAAGVIPGDSLSGLFGENGTGNAILFEILVCCLFFGHWIMTRQGMGLLLAVGLCMISSVLGEMKLFPVALAIIGVIAAGLYGIKYHTPGKMLAYVTLTLIILFGFVSLYNAIVPGAGEFPLQAYLTNSSERWWYLNRAESYNDNGVIYTDIGRGYALRLGWESIQKNPSTFLFGYGIGARSESRSLGTAGVALTSGDLGLSAGTSLLVMMQEMGVLGMIVLTGFWLWALRALINDIRSFPESPASFIRYALFLFSALWPLWLWYAVTWTMRVPMLLYWLLLGYVFAEARIASSFRHVKVLDRTN
jgi:hypothetical protein